MHGIGRAQPVRPLLRGGGHRLGLVAVGIEAAERVIHALDRLRQCARQHAGCVIGLGQLQFGIGERACVGTVLIPQGTGARPAHVALQDVRPGRGAVTALQQVVCEQG